jgi:hypothetical protein
MAGTLIKQDQPTRAQRGQPRPERPVRCESMIPGTRVHEISPA